MKAQKLDVHLDVASELGQRRVDERRVGGEPRIEVDRRHDHPESERHRSGGVQGGGDDVVVQGQGPRVGLGQSIELAHEDHEIAQAPKLDGAPDARARRTPRRREPVGDRVEVLVHAAPRAPDGAPQARGGFDW